MESSPDQQQHQHLFLNSVNSSSSSYYDSPSNAFTLTKQTLCPPDPIGTAPSFLRTPVSAAGMASFNHVNGHVYPQGVAAVPPSTLLNLDMLLNEGKFYHVTPQDDASVPISAPHTESTTPTSTAPASTVDDEEFPTLAPKKAGGLGTFVPGGSATANFISSRQRMTVKSSAMTQIINVSYEERRFKPVSGTTHLGEPQNSEQNRICCDIMQRTGTHLELQSNGDNSLTVLVQGKIKNVEDAKRLVIQQLQTQASNVISIPKEYHSSLLGKSGQTLRSIEEETGARVTIPKINNPSTDVKITGSRSAVAEAARKLNLIYEEQSKYSTQRLKIEKDFLPFIRGPNGQLLASLEEKTGAKIRLPPANIQNGEIIVNGLKDDVAQAVNTINSIYAEKKRVCTKFVYKIDRTKHKYIVGPRGSHIQEVLAATGVYIIMPPTNAPEDERDLIVLFGPTRLHGNALTLVLDKANSMISETLDVPRWIHKHILKPQGDGIKDINAAFPKIHLDFKRDPDVINIEGPPEDVQKVFLYLQGLIKQICQRVRILEIPVDAKLHPYIVGKGGMIINKIRDVSKVENIKVPGDKGPNFVQIEGTPESIAIAHREILDIVDKKENEKSDEIIMDSKFHPLIIGVNGEKIKELRERFNNVIINIPRRNDEQQGVGANRIALRGDKKDVENCKKYLEEMKKTFAQICFGDFCLPEKFTKCHPSSQVRYKRYLREAYPTVEFRFPSTAGSGNQSISSSRSTSPDGGLETKSTTPVPIKRGSAKGTSAMTATSNEDRPKFSVRANLKSEFDALKKSLPESIIEIRLSNPTTSTTKGTKKGEEASAMTGGNSCNSLSIQEKANLVKACEKDFGTMVRFPLPRDTDADIVTIFGPKAGVEKAKNLIKQSLTDLSLRVTLDCVVEPKFYPLILGAKGVRINEFSTRYGVRIKMPTRKPRSNPKPADQQRRNSNEAVANGGDEVRDTMDEAHASTHASDDDHVIHITGKMDDCQKAREAILAIIPANETMAVPVDIHRMIIGPRGRDIKNFNSQYRVNLSVPSPEDNSELIKISGSKGNVDKAREALETLVQKLKLELAEKELTSYAEEVDIDPKFHGQLIGRRSVDINKFCADNAVKVFFPNNDSRVKVTGHKDKVPAAVQLLKERVGALENYVSEEFEVNSKIIPRIIGSQGKNIRQLMTKYQVDIRTPRSDSALANITISGLRENVAEAKDYISLLNAEFLQDMADRDEERRYTRAPARTYDSVIGDKLATVLPDTRYNAPLDPEDCDVITTVPATLVAQVIEPETKMALPTGSAESQEATDDLTIPSQYDHTAVNGAYDSGAASPVSSTSSTPSHAPPLFPDGEAGTVGEQSTTCHSSARQHDDTPHQPDLHNVPRLNGHQGPTMNGVAGHEMNGFGMANGGKGDFIPEPNQLDDDCISDPEEPFLTQEGIGAGGSGENGNDNGGKSFYETMLASKTVLSNATVERAGLKKLMHLGEVLEEECEEDTPSPPNGHVINGTASDTVPIENGDGLIIV